MLKLSIRKAVTTGQYERQADILVNPDEFWNVFKIQILEVAERHFGQGAELKPCYENAVAVHRNGRFQGMIEWSKSDLSIKYRMAA